MTERNSFPDDRAATADTRWRGGATRGAGAFNISSKI